MARFRTRARAVDLLGKQQIRDEVTAITELLRNSYDADADEGLIDVSTKKDRIFVWDDGDGMTIEDIEEKWLTLGTYSKADKKMRKSRRGRVKIGEKGIGRLAISLFGDQCLLITKSVASGDWAVLYLHWELFRNPNIFLEEITLPIRSYHSFEQMIHQIREGIPELKEELLQNFTQIKKWDSSVEKRVKEEVDKFHVSEDAYPLLNSIEKRGHGTLFHIKNLEYSWDWNGSSKNTKDRNFSIKERRLKNILSSFQNIFEMLDVAEADGTDSFYPRIHVNGNKLEDETWLNEDDISMFDYALIGKIEEGFFKGRALIKTLDGVKEFSEEVNVTEGILNPKEQDCGPIDIKFYFVEGDAHNSALSKEQHSMITKKLNDTGGVFVFRDGLRILPYGEQGNDFLYMEERRSLRAATYLFSHRRMFGYMGISKEKNPNLVDKSSREGFVENKEYIYFQTAGINLLKWWATGFLESNDKLGKRSSRIEAINQAKEEEKKAQEIKKEEEKRERTYFNDLDKKLLNFNTNLESTAYKNKTELSRIIQRYRDAIAGIDSMSQLNQKSELAKKEIMNAIDQFDSIAIRTNTRYEHPIAVLDQVHSANHALEDKKNKLYEEFIIKIQQEVNHHKDQLSQTFMRATEENKLKQLTQRIDEAVYSYGLPLSYMHKVEEKAVSTLISLFDPLIDELTKSIKKETKERSVDLQNFIYMMDEDLSRLHDQKSRLESFERYMNGNVYDETLKLLESFESKISSAEEKVQIFEHQVLHSKTMQNTKYALEALTQKVKRNEYLEDDEALIGLLKKEVNMFRDLSAVGLAAELTSHEFNATYQKIKQNIQYLTKALSKTKVLPVLQNLNNAFYSLERLHQRMSPLYKQTRMKKADINIKLFIESTVEYFSSDIDRLGINIVIDIPKDMTIRETESILFTPMINLLSNAIYWIINSEKKEIHFYADTESNAIYVHDTGQGIQTKDQDSIFEPYFSRKLEGRGLGLYLSKNILETRGHSLKFVAPEETLRDLSGACFGMLFNINAIGGMKNAGDRRLTINH